MSTGFSSKKLVIDGRGHLVGRLASIVAKQLLLGTNVVVLRCEDLQQSGHFFRNKIKFLSYLRKRCNVNPARGAFHFRAPSRMLYKAVRGMIPHKTGRGQKALKRFQAFEGIPPTYTKVKRVCVPKAMKVMCLRSDRRHCRVGRVSAEVGWHYQEVVNNLESKRKVRETLEYRHKKKLQRITARARTLVADRIAHQNKTLKKYGYDKTKKVVKKVIAPKPLKASKKSKAKAKIVREAAAAAKA